MLLHLTLIYKCRYALYARPYLQHQVLPYGHILIGRSHLGEGARNFGHDGHRASRSLEPGMIMTMTVVKINAITVPADSGDELARRFAARAGAVDDADGFEGFELLRPADDRTIWLVVTRWRDEKSFQAWVSSPAFSHGHRSAAERAGGDAPPPVGVSSELWSYTIANV
jgi:heme oxygenase (mycobilin-producing)